MDVGRSLTAVAGLLEATGKTDEAAGDVPAVGVAAEPARRAPTRRRGRRWRTAGRGWAMLLSNTGQVADALAAYRQARADQEALAAAPGASAEARRDLADTIHRIGILLMQTGKPSEAEAEFRRALEIRQKLAADNPAVTEFRTNLAASHINLGIMLMADGQAVGGGGRVPPGAWRSWRSWPPTTPPSPNSAYGLAISHAQPRRPC